MQANLLRGILAERGLTQKKLAELVGMKQNTLSSRMTGQSCFDTDEINKICSVLCIVDPIKKVDIFLK